MHNFIPLTPAIHLELPGWLFLRWLSLWWRKENRFYRIFISLAFAGIAVSWGVEIFLERMGFAWQQITENLRNGRIRYVYSLTFSGAIAAAVAETIRAEPDRRTEQHLMRQRQELAMSCENSTDPQKADTEAKNRAEANAPTRSFRRFFTPVFRTTCRSRHIFFLGR